MFCLGTFFFFNWGFLLFFYIYSGDPSYVLQVLHINVELFVAMCVDTCFCCFWGNLRTFIYTTRKVRKSANRDEWCYFSQGFQNSYTFFFRHQFHLYSIIYCFVYHNLTPFFILFVLLFFDHVIYTHIKYRIFLYFYSITITLHITFYVL